MRIKHILTAWATSLLIGSTLTGMIYGLTSYGDNDSNIVEWVLIIGVYAFILSIPILLTLFALRYLLVRTLRYDKQFVAAALLTLCGVFAGIQLLDILVWEASIAFSASTILGFALAHRMPERRSTTLVL